MTEAREAFEKWYASNFAEKFVNVGAQLEKRGDQYIDFHAQDMWEVWQEQQKKIEALKAENAELHSANVNMLNAKLSMQKSIDDAENYLHVALNSVDDETLCKSYLLSAVNALRGGSHE